jgi:hypothetical protein
MGTHIISWTYGLEMYISPLLGMGGWLGGVTGTSITSPRAIAQKSIIRNMNKKIMPLQQIHKYKNKQTAQYEAE